MSKLALRDHDILFDKSAQDSTERANLVREVAARARDLDMGDLRRLAANLKDATRRGDDL